jgi:hypothetical protein
MKGENMDSPSRQGSEGSVSVSVNSQPSKAGSWTWYGLLAMLIASLLGNGSSYVDSNNWATKAREFGSVDQDGKPKISASEQSVAAIDADGVTTSVTMVEIRYVLPDGRELLIQPEPVRTRIDMEVQPFTPALPLEPVPPDRPKRPGNTGSSQESKP